MHFCADEVDKERPGVGGVLKHQHNSQACFSYSKPLLASSCHGHTQGGSGGAHVPQKPATVDKYFLFAKNL